MSIDLIILALFLGVVIHKEFNISARIKSMLKIRISKYIKILDCFPCFTWWLSVLISVVMYFISNEIHIFEPLTVFLISIFYEQNERI